MKKILLILLILLLSGCGSDLSLGGVKDDEKALIEAHKLLNTDGVLILEVPSGNFLYDEYDKELLHFRRYNMKDLVKKIENAGFRIEKKTHLGFLLFPFFNFPVFITF